MNYQQAARALESGRVEPLYALVGDEGFLQEMLLRRLLELTVDPASRDFNLDVFYAHDSEPGRIVEAANAYPMMAERRTVVIKGADKLGPKGIELLGKYANKPSPSTVLVLLSEKLNQRLKGVKEIKDHGVWVECKQLYDRQVPEWIRNHAQAQGLEVAGRAAELLHTLVGNNLRDLANELDKIVLNIEDRTRVEEQDVRTVVGFRRAYGPFDLNDAVGERDLRRALTILGYLLEIGESATAIVARLARHFSLLVKVKALSEQGATKSDIARATGLHPFFVERYRNQAAGYGFDELGSVFEALLETDIALKSSAQSPRLAAELLLIHICKGILPLTRFFLQAA